MMRRYTWLASAARMGCIAVLATLAACSSTITTTATGGPGGGSSTTASGSTTTSTSTTGAPPTATPIPANCAALVPGSGTINVMGFGDVPYPAGSVGGMVTSPQNAIAPGTFRIYLEDDCAPGTSASAVRSFYASQMPANGWVYSSTLPFDGQYEQPCGDAYCWGKDHAPRLVGLEHVMDHAGGYVTFRMRYFMPPGPPDCGTLVFGGPGQAYTLYYRNLMDIPLPPLTQVGSGHQQYHMQENPLCSSGLADIALGFMQGHLPMLGWTAGSPSPQTFCGEPAGVTFTGYTAWTKGSRALYIQYSDGGVTAGTGGDLIYCS